MNEIKNKINNKTEIIILAIESSCDETSVAVVKNGRKIMSNVIYSQIDIHKIYGGVVPEIASRNHVKKISLIIERALKDANLSFSDIDAIGVTYGPGLVGALLVGLSSAKAIAYSLNIPLIGVNHIDGHISANYIEHKDLEPPFICLVASGGHSHLVKVEDYGKYTVVGQTRDDAAGEAFDKIARALQLGYPGGPLIDAAAKKGNPNAIEFPRSFLEAGSFDFSFSGLKSAVLNYLNQQKMKGKSINVNDVAASFQQSVIDVLTTKTVQAAVKYNFDKICLAGGVASNTLLREKMNQLALQSNVNIYYPKPVLCTDNAAMIASAAYYNLMTGKISDMYLNAVPNLKL